MKTAHLTVLIAACGMWACGPSPVASNETMEDELASSTDALGVNNAETWFPMQDGNRWSFVSPSGVGRDVSMDGVFGNVAWVEGLMFEGRWLGTSHTAPNSLYTYNEDTKAWSPFIRFGYAQTSWTWGAGACSEYTVRRSASNLTVTTPAGTFTGARTLSFERTPNPLARCAAPAFSELTFAPNVGLIAINTYGEKFLLKSAKVNGKTLPAATGVKGSLRLDKSIYTNSPDTIVCITTPCPSNAVTATAKATYSVTNNGTKSETWQFNSGCQFNVSIVDDRGQTVRSLADNRFCTLALTSFTLAPGQSKVFTADFALENRVGDQLFGNFTAKASLGPTNTASIAESVASFIVQRP